jgi:hypothetical protein
MFFYCTDAYRVLQEDSLCTLPGRMKTFNAAALRNMMTYMVKFDDKLKDMIEDLEVSDGVVSIILRGSMHALSCSA